MDRRVALAVTALLVVLATAVGTVAKADSPPAASSAQLCRQLDWPGTVERAATIIRPLNDMIQADQRTFGRIDGGFEGVDLLQERATTANVRSLTLELRNCIGPAIDKGPPACQWLQGRDKDACLSAPACQWVQDRGACLTAPPQAQAQVEAQSLLQPNACVPFGLAAAQRRARLPTAQRTGSYDDTEAACQRAANRARAAQIAESQYERTCGGCSRLAAQWKSVPDQGLAWADGRDAELAKEEACRGDASCVKERAAAAAEKQRIAAIQAAEVNLKKISDGLCQDIAVRRDAVATIARENSNPAGVRDLAALHEAGSDIQDMNKEIPRLKGLYAAQIAQPGMTTRRPFTEAMCR